MSKLPADPYGHLHSTDKVKLQSYVDPNAKDRLMLVLPDRTLYTLLINYALKRAVDFCNDNNLQYNTADQQRLIGFLVTGNGLTTSTPTSGPSQHTTPRLGGSPVPRDVTGGSAKVRPTPKNSRSKSTVIQQESEG